MKSDYLIVSVLLMSHVLYPTFDEGFPPLHLFLIYPSCLLFICVQGTFVAQWLTSNTAAAGASTENVIYSLKMQPLVDRWIWVSILPLFYISPNDSVVFKLAHFQLPLLSLTQTITLLVKVTFVCRICSILTSFFIHYPFQGIGTWSL